MLELDAGAVLEILHRQVARSTNCRRAIADFLGALIFADVDEFAERAGWEGGVNDDDVGYFAKEGYGRKTPLAVVWNVFIK